MVISETNLAGVVTINTHRYVDDRGTFQRLYCNESFTVAGLPSAFVQSNLSANRRKHTLRGLHYQREPYQEDKLVYCVHGEILDVVLDVRETSLTFGSYFMTKLSAENGTALLVPKGLAHGYLTLTDDATVVYAVTNSYVPDCEAGIRWNDPTFSISWPIRDPIVSVKDANWPNFIRSDGL